MTPPRARKRPDPTASNTALTPSTDALRVGDAAPQPAPGKPARTRVPFGSYLDPDLQRTYKARCVLLGIEMQDALEEAIRDWLDSHPV